MALLLVGFSLVVAEFTVTTYKKCDKVHGYWSQWSDWSECSCKAEVTTRIMAILVSYFDPFRDPM